MRQLKHWQDPLNGLLGAWLVASPWALGFSGETQATANMAIIGALLVAAALGAMLMPRAWEEWTETVLGLWLIVSPWVVGFADHANANLVAVATGAAVMVLALWTLIADKDYSAWWRRGTAH